MPRRVALLAIFPVLIGLTFLTLRSRPPAQAQSSKPSPSAPAPVSMQYVGAWGMKGSGPGQLDDPTAIATDALGNVFVADAGSRFIHKFDAQGTPLLSFQDDWIRSPEAVALDRGGAIYTADATRGGISIFLPSGDHLHDLKLKSRPHAEDTLGVTVADDGLIFILDRNAAQVLVYNAAFRLTQTWRSSAGSVPSTPDAIAYGSDGFVYLLDAQNNRVGRFSENGQLASEITIRRAGTNLRLGGEFAAAAGCVFVIDGDGLTLHVFASDGARKLDFDLSPQLGHEHRFIPALAVSPRHELLVLDSPGSRVLRYRLNF
jgi:DNA-binding beta-propeller fold protein YncE